jgi:hypothetical protein
MTSVAGADKSGITPSATYTQRTAKWFEQVVPEYFGTFVGLFRLTKLLALGVCSICKALSKQGLELAARVGIGRFMSDFEVEIANFLRQLTNSFIAWVNQK